MVTKIRKVGNSKGLIIPDALLRQCQISENVSLEIKDDSIVIKPIASNPRENWENVFDQLFSEEDLGQLRNISNKFDEEEWTWLS